MKKRMLSLTLALIMLLGLLPVAHAEDAYLWPSDSTSTSQGYGNGHNGQDITSTKGSDIYATKSGTVVAVYTGCANNNAASSSGKSCGSATGCEPSLNYYKMNGKTVCNYGYGNGLAIKHSDGSGYSTYSHMQSVSVTVGQTVAQGDVVGQMGSAGNSTGTHCHFELVSEGSMTEGGKYFRPTKWINNNKSAVTYVVGLGVEFLPAVQSTWASKEKVTETNAVVVAQIKKNNGVKVTEVGLDLYDANGTLIKSYSQKVTTPDTSTSWPCYWDINEEIGVTLTPGTTYQYCFTGVFNGERKEGNLWSFKTGGQTPETNTPTPAPPVTQTPEPPVTSEPGVTTSPEPDNPGPINPPETEPSDEPFVSQLPKKFPETREWSLLQFDDISTKDWYYGSVKSAY
ncbi:MAG: peptidoglycan DD-metalloendopeptidase family protein, partial [Oscillospiraceae bacterium]|nr:peptidoglycan DD-metalloendopeptidase family protein [Oscillospiraceae bacterium]